VWVPGSERLLAQRATRRETSRASPQNAAAVRRNVHHRDDDGNWMQAQSRPSLDDRPAQALDWLRPHLRRRGTEPQRPG
jgi:hypothetical protein